MTIDKETLLGKMQFQWGAQTDGPNQPKRITMTLDCLSVYIEKLKDLKVRLVGPLTFNGCPIEVVTSQTEPFLFHKK